MVLFIMFPAIMTAGNVAMFFLVPAAYWGMAVFNLPISIGLSSYWAMLFVGIGNMLTMVEGQDNTPVE